MKEKKQKINLYDMNNKGYFDAQSVINADFQFTFITGGRGIGKTYGVLKWLIQNNITFIYLRRTQNECDLQSVEMTSSLTKLLNRYANEYKFSKVSKNVGMVEYDGGVIYTCALSTFASMRGINFDDVKFVVFDEFIKEPHVRSIKGEGFALSNLMESIERNRAWETNEHVRLICLANSMDIANDTFMAFDLVSDAERMMNEGQEVFMDGDKLLIICQKSPISQKKLSTGLYKNASEEFAKMSINNEFVLNDFSYVKKRNLKEYQILLNVGDLYFYKHKAKMEYYVSFVKQKTKRSYDDSLSGLEKFRRKEWRYYMRYLDGFVYFENYKSCRLFEKYYEK